MNSLIFRTTAHIVAGLMLVFSFYLLLRGHNQPGGGFIGALIAVIGFSLLLISESSAYVRNRLRFQPMRIATFGIMLAILSGLISLVIGKPFMTGLWWKDILPIGTPLLFDIGVFLAVLGSVLGILLELYEDLS